jgi:hypothetical protein
MLNPVSKLKSMVSETHGVFLTPAQKKRQAREAHLNKVRARTAKRETIRAFLGNKHGVNPRRVVLMDTISHYDSDKGRYVIKNKRGPNLKFNFA